MPNVIHIYVLLSLARPHVRHVYVLLPLIIPHVRHAHLGLYIAVSFNSRTTCIWSFGCSFALLLQWDVLSSNHHLVQLFFCDY